MKFRGGLGKITVFLSKLIKDPPPRASCPRDAALAHALLEGCDAAGHERLLVLTPAPPAAARRSRWRRLIDTHLTTCLIRGAAVLVVKRFAGAVQTRKLAGNSLARI
eukprot:scaffold2144_cov215-Pinguiococcus_pyrenoidosus.AAC.8